MKDVSGNYIEEFKPNTVILIRACKNLIERIEKGLDYNVELKRLKFELEEFNK